jgi:hypothetical protein
MIDPITLQMIRDIVTIFGVIAGFTYYVMTVRNANKVRKTQLLMQLRTLYLDKEWLTDFADLLESEWTDIEDFNKKYGYPENPEHMAKRFRLFEYLDGVGYLLHENLIDIKSLYYMSQASGTPMQWRKWKPVIEEIYRKPYNNPDWWKWFEYLAEEITKERIRRGLPPEMTEPDEYIIKH